LLTPLHAFVLLQYLHPMLVGHYLFLVIQSQVLHLHLLLIHALLQLFVFLLHRLQLVMVLILGLLKMAHFHALLDFFKKPRLFNIR
jgi:hypothetical protein